MDIKMEQDAPNDLQSAINKNSNEEEMVEDSSRKRSGDCLDEVLPPSLMEKCKAYFCGVCSQKLPSQMISTAHYAGTPHEENITRELVKLGIKSPPKLKKSKKHKTRNHVFCNVCNNFVETEDHLLTSHKLEKAHLKKLEILKLKRDVCNVFLNSDDSPIHQKQLQMIEQNKTSYTCDLCEIMTTDLNGLKMHLQGNSHEKKAKQLSTKKTKVSPQLSTKQTNVVPDNSSLVEKCTPMFCGVCLISLTSLVVSEAHYAGKPHKKKVRLTLEKMSQEQTSETTNTTSMSCDVCNIVVNCEESLNSHMAGKSHKKIVKNMNSGQQGKPQQSNSKSSKTKNSNSISCDVCNIFVSSEETLNGHKLGKAHLKKLKMTKHFKCDLCNIFVTSEEILNGHKFGQAHRKKLQMMKQQVKCDLCNIFVSSEETLNMHKVGQAHQEKLAMTAQDQTSFPCGVCGFTTTDEDDLEMHLLGHSEQQVVPDNTIMDESEMGNKETGGVGNVSLPTVENIVTLERKESCSEEEQGESSEDLYKLPQDLPNVSNKSLDKEEVVVLPENFEVNKLSKEDDNLDDAVSSDDDLIILESQDSFPPSNNESLATAPVIESVKLCEYPVGERHNVTVSTQDYASLEHDTFLNDIIIDFYLLYLAKNVLPIEDRENVHIFSTMFYKRLLQSPRKDAKNIPEYETDPTLTPAEVRHFRVAGWTKNVDLFGKDMLIVPICECSHWYLLLIVKPGLIFVQAKKEERTKKGEPFVIVLDSVGGTKNTAVKNIRRYLACEWEKKKCVGENANEISSNELASSASQMRTLRPNKPEQENNSDCGIYLLHYVEKVFENVSAFLWKSLVTYRTREWFTIEEVGKKRGEIAELIKGLAAEQRPGEEIEYPQIKFTAESLEEGITEEAEAEIGMNTWK